MDQIATLGYVSCTNQIATLGYISCTNHITAFGYHAPITAFGYCFLVNDAMESGGYAQKMTLTRNFGLIWWVLWLWSLQEPHRTRSRFIWISKVCVHFHCIILKLKTCSFHSFSHNAHVKQLTFHHTLWKQHPKSNQKLPNHCTTWTLGNFSSAWIVFYQSNSILPH